MCGVTYNILQLYIIPCIRHQRMQMQAVHSGYLNVERKGKAMLDNLMAL